MSISGIPPSYSSHTFDETGSESILRQGISYAKAGYHQQARRLLEEAITMNPADVRPWIWLATTTDDPAEQRKYLETAVATDPGNAEARRALVEFNGKLDQARLVPQGEGAQPLRPDEPADAQAEVRQCPQCGGQVRFDVDAQSLVCTYCGYNFETQNESAAGKQGELIDFVLPTTVAHRWAETQQRVNCERCGAMSLVPPGQKTDQCPYCGSNRMVQAPEAAELVDPEALVVMKVDASKAARAVKNWLTKGFFAPDDLALKAAGLHLRPAYYSFWSFSGTIEINWHCEVNVGTSRNPNWVPRSGNDFQFFDDILTPGVKALRTDEVAQVEPFNLKELVDFKPDTLMGWTTLTYDRSLADASLLARQKVIKQLANKLRTSVEPGSEKRDLSTGAGKWSGLTYKHLLLPLWVGMYKYQGQVFRVLVNGQTGKVAGAKPRDNVKVAMVAAGAALLVMILMLVLYWIWTQLPPA